MGSEMCIRDRRQGVRSEFTEHEEIVKDMLSSLTGTNVLAFPSYEAAAARK